MATKLVMIVDDQASVRSVLAAQLDLEGYEVVEAADGTEAIGILLERAVDAVISDVRMPGPVDGIGLAVWAARNTPSVSVLLISGQRPPHSLRDQLPDTPFFRKPVRFADVASALALRIH